MMTVYVNGDAEAREVSGQDEDGPVPRLAMDEDFFRARSGRVNITRRTHWPVGTPVVFVSRVWEGCGPG